MGQSVKNLPAMHGNWGLIAGSGRSSGEGNGNPLQYSRLENPMDRGAWQATVHGFARVRHDLVTKPVLVSARWVRAAFHVYYYIPFICQVLFKALILTLMAVPHFTSTPRARDWILSASLKGLEFFKPSLIIVHFKSVMMVLYVLKPLSARNT